MVSELWWSVRVGVGIYQGNILKMQQVGRGEECWNFTSGVSGAKCFEKPRAEGSTLHASMTVISPVLYISQNESLQFCLHHLYWGSLFRNFHGFQLCKIPSTDSVIVLSIWKFQLPVSFTRESFHLSTSKLIW